MSFLEGIGFELGIGIAIGMLAGTTGTHGSARGRMTLLAAVIGFVVGYLLSGHADLDALLGAVICLAGAIGFLVSLVAVIVAVAALLLPALTLIVIIALAWLGIARHRRAQRKHEGLRILR
jgi:uncharacterized paraquat-inducible protein A